MLHLLATLCVDLSLTLFALGNSNSTCGFCIKTLTCCRPTAIMGPILDKVGVSCNVEGASCEELGWCINSCLLRPCTAPVRAQCFASSVVTPRGYKASGCPYVNLCALAQHLIISSPPSLQL
jgi:hypothetical protein